MASTAPVFSARLVAGGRIATLVAAFCVAVAPTAIAQTVTAPGYVYSFVTLSSTTQSCVAIGRGGTFVGRGPGFAAAAQSIVFVTESGEQRVVATGFNSLSDCAYDSGGDVLYATDNSLELPGAVTGDTVYAIPDASEATDLPVLGLELVPPGSIPSAASVAIGPPGSVYVSNAAGGTAGSVALVSDSALSPVVTGLGFAGGVAVEQGGALLVAESLDTLESRLSRYGANGQLLGVLSGPTFEHGSYDLALDSAGRALVTGSFQGPIVAVDTQTGEAEDIAEGFTFATSLDVNRFTGRIQLVSSSFEGQQEDFRLHSLIPVAGLSAMAVPDDTDHRECVIEIYGIEPLVDLHGNVRNVARCVDGSACDADGQVNQSCTFPFGVCLNVADERFPGCVSGSTDSFQLKQMRPENEAVRELIDTVGEALPFDGPRCFLTEGLVVPLRIGRKSLRPGKQMLELKARSLEPVRRADGDAIKLFCDPAQP